MTKLETKNGPISYVDYFKTRYNITIKDMKQPLVITRTKERDRRAGMTACIDPGFMPSHWVD